LTQRVFKRDIGGRGLFLETGKLAGQAQGAVVVRYGETVVLATACASTQPREGVDFFPLTVDYEERLYAVGRIPGSFFRREGRPTQEAILTARLTDRPIRPLFPKGFRNDVQVIITVLSTDQENDPAILSIIGASAALSMSNIPFDGPLAATRIGFIDGALVVNPTMRQVQQSKLDLVIAGTRDAVMMVEAGVHTLDESTLLEAIKLGQQTNLEVIALQDELVRECGSPKTTFVVDTGAEQDAVTAVRGALNGRLEDVLGKTDRTERETALTALKKDVTEKLAGKFAANQVGEAFHDLEKAIVRQSIVGRQRRLDGRGPKDIRTITCEVGLLPRTHGSGLFTRGQTQVLSISTLGSTGERQRLDTLGLEEFKRYMHHYNMPPFASGEARRLGSPGRREVGHGALAERALLPVIPSEEEFPYTIRVVSEVLSSNGSTSMASVCGSTLSLMDAGVPIKAPVAGVAMGLIKEGSRHVILTDIAGEEDHLGDMDFKVAGTSEGVTALQMDIKIKGISPELMAEALAHAKEARLFILSKMKQTMAEPRAQLSPFAPRMIRIQIRPEKIGALIGPGGKNIRAIIDQTKCTIDVEDDGSVVIGSTSGEASDKAIAMIEGLTKEVEVGAVYTGKVTRITDFGAFVEIMPGKDGLVRVGELADHRVERVEDEVKIGDEMTVMVIEIDRMGRINLSRRAILEGGPRPPAGPGSEAGEGGAPFRRPGPPPRREGGFDRDRRSGPPGFRGGQGGPPRGGGYRQPPYRGPAESTQRP